MNLVIDVGNTQFKFCVFNRNKLIEHLYLSELNREMVNHLFTTYEFKQAIFSDTRGINSKDLRTIIPDSIPLSELKSSTPLPITIGYQTPETLGKDRIAGAVGAWSIFPGKPILVIDIGTAITFDFISAEGVFVGGTISPGPQIRFASLNEYTGKLPLLTPSDHVELTGYSTKTAIQFGVQNGILFEINGYIVRYVEEYPDLKVILTGGYANLFDKKIKYPIFAELFLVPKGLNRILTYNE